MSLAFPEIRVGEPIRRGVLSVFPLFSTAPRAVEYLLSAKALVQGTVKVKEVSKTGSVPELLVRNTGDLRVLFLEGEELVGAKQNRILNTSVLIAAQTTTKLPVSCVEAGRWRYRSRLFGPSQWYSPARLRATVKASVRRSLRHGRGHRSDQGAVWAEVARLQVKFRTASPTEAMFDTFEAHRDRIAEIREALSYQAGATGLAVALGKNIVSFDLFDKPSTCEQVWTRLLSGCVLDALEVEPQGDSTSAQDVENLLKASQQMRWEPFPAAGEGQEYRAEQEGALYGSALVFDGTIVHLNVTAAC